MRFFSIDNIEELDFNKLVRQLPGGGGWNPFNTRGAYIRAILESYPLLQQYEINTPMRLAHFLGQGLVETGCLAHRAENLNYSAERLRAVFPSYFPTDEIAREYERKPERIANYVYANRLGNGPPESGDGWRYRGRGFFQLTGRENYRNYGQIAGFDLENDPELIERDLKKSLQVAAAYFKHVGLGAFADSDDCAAVSRGVNRGNPRASRPAHGEADRILWTNRAIDLVRDPQALLVRASNDGVLRIGATGEPVKEVQRWLVALGYAIGPIDGVFGPATRRALVSFQEEHRLNITGTVDEATRTAIKTELNMAPQTIDMPAVVPAPAPEPAPTPEAPAPSAGDPQPAPIAASPEPAPSAPPEPSQPTPAPVEAAPVEIAPTTPATDGHAETAPAAPHAEPAANGGNGAAAAAPPTNTEPTSAAPRETPQGEQPTQSA
ncbi:MAG: peptidoglycan-binding protein [Hyphomonadaceae bacterium]